jgi:cell wall-associated NlpC family hydrolase
MKDEALPASTGCWPAIIVAVRACVGTRFRVQGRVPGLGLDCVGVVLVAAAAAGMMVAPPLAYALAADNREYLDHALAEAGCQPVAAALAGDILVFAPAPLRRHLGVMTAAGMVHAHAGLGRVVEGPIDLTWPIVGRWRLPGAR